MKKILVILLAFALCFTVLAGCGGGSSEPAADESAEPITIKIAHTDSSSRSTNTWAEWLGEYLEEKKVIMPLKIDVIDFVLKARHRVINMRSLLLQAADECWRLREFIERFRDQAGMNVKG